MRLARLASAKEAGVMTIRPRRFQPLFAQSSARLLRLRRRLRQSPVWNDPRRLRPRTVPQIIPSLVVPCRSSQVDPTKLRTTVVVKPDKTACQCFSTTSDERRSEKDGDFAQIAVSSKWRRMNYPGTTRQHHFPLHAGFQSDHPIGIGVLLLLASASC